MLKHWLGTVINPWFRHDAGADGPRHAAAALAALGPRPDHAHAGMIIVIIIIN